MPYPVTRRDYLITSSSAFTFFILSFFSIPSCSLCKSFGKKLIVTKKSGSRGSPDNEWWEKVKEYDLRYIKQIRYSSAKTSSRIVIDLERRAEYTYKLLRDGRFYIDFTKTVLDPPKIDFPIDDQTLKDIKVAQYSKEVVRLVINLKDLESTVNVFPLPQNKDSDERIVIDVFTTVAPAPHKPETKKTDSSSLSRTLGVKIKQVLIDPGHGGRDPGTHSGGLKEKDIVLTVAREVNKILMNETILKTHLTRNRDTFIPLEERMAIARNWGTDLFVSIHINACHQPDRRGIETYYLSLTTDPDAMATAEHENAWANLARHEIGQTLSSILTKNSKIEDSRQFAGLIQQNLIKKTKQIDRGVKKAPFVVLIGADMPSVLTEIGFMSNKNDRKLLGDRGYLKKIARSIADGITEYSETFSQIVRK